MNRKGGEVDQVKTVVSAVSTKEMQNSCAPKSYIDLNNIDGVKNIVIFSINIDPMGSPPWLSKE